MLELIIKKQDDKKNIALVENAKLIEYYEENENTNRNEGNIYIGVVKDILKGMQSAFVDIGLEKNSFIYVKDVITKIDEKKQKQDLDIDIRDVIKPNQKILVQVKKDSNEKKGARVSTHISLSSKYIVLMPNTDIITISQKIENQEEQERLINLAKQNLKQGNGIIIRTSAEGKTKEVIDDIKRQEKLWENIEEKYKKYQSNEPKLIYKSADIVEKMLEDLSQEKLESIIVNSKEDYEKIKKIKEENKELKNIKLVVKNEEEILKIYDLEKQIEKLQNRKIWLKCGGFITIDKTEALTAIDVNTGKYTGSKDLEKTIYKVNEEATVEIAKQLRLRDIGGIIIIDYIDMKVKEDKEKIENLLKKCLKKDRTKTQIEGFTKLDLMELTRKHICSGNEDNKQC